MKCMICQCVIRTPSDDSRLCGYCRHGSFERRFVEAARSGEVQDQDPVEVAEEEVEVHVDSPRCITQADRVLAPDSEEEAEVAQLTEQVADLLKKQERLDLALKDNVMLREENSKHVQEILAFRRQLAERCREVDKYRKALMERNRELNNERAFVVEAATVVKEGDRQREELKQKLQEAKDEVKKVLESSRCADFWFENYKELEKEKDKLQERLKEAFEEINRLNREVDLDIPSMVREIEQLKDTLEKRERAVAYRSDCYNKVSLELAETQQKLKDCEAQRDAAEKDYMDKKAMAEEIHSLREEKKRMKEWGRSTWAKVKEQGAEIIECQKELKELQEAEAKYLARIRELEAVNGHTTRMMEQYQRLWLKDAPSNPSTPVSQDIPIPIPIPDAPLRRSTSDPVPAQRCLFPEKRTREEDEEDKDQNERAKKKLDF